MLDDEIWYIIAIWYKCVNIPIGYMKMSDKKHGGRERDCDCKRSLYIKKKLTFNRRKYSWERERNPSLLKKKRKKICGWIEKG